MSLINVVERKLENGLELSIQGVWLRDSMMQSSLIDFGCGIEPLFTLHYNGTNLYTCFTNEGKKDYLVVLASGFRYGFKSYHVDYEEGSVVDLLENTGDCVIHVKRVKIECSTLDIRSGDFLQAFVSHSSRHVPNFLYFYNYKDITQISLDGKDAFSYKDFEEKDIKYFMQCNDSTFVYVTKELTAKLVDFQSGVTRFLKEIPLALGDMVHFTSFCLFKKYNKLLLCMQDHHCNICVIDLLLCQKVAHIPLAQKKAVYIDLNWNMEELSVCSYNASIEHFLDVFKIPQCDLSLKNLSRLCVLTTYTKQQLTTMTYLPVSLKKYLGLGFPVEVSLP